TTQVFRATNEQEIDAAFAGLGAARANALLVAADPIFYIFRQRLAALALQYSVGTVLEYREFAIAGGLMSYGSSLIEGFRQLGFYTGRVLNGENPANLPILQPTKFDLVINLKTAKALGLNVPPTLIARADEVIE